MLDTTFLKGFMPPQELESLIKGTRGEEKDYFVELIEKTIRRIRDVPELRSLNDRKMMDAPVKLHYLGGASDWWIAALDRDRRRAFGFVCLNGMTDFAQLGFIYMDELLRTTYPVEIRLMNGTKPEKVKTRVGIELDLYWKERPIGEIIREVKGN